MKLEQANVPKDPAEIIRLVESMPMCIVSTDSINGVFNPVYKDGSFYFHMRRVDEQCKKLEETKKGTLIFFDFLCNIPSYWIDPNDGGVATSYYRYAEFHCHTEILKEKHELAELLPIFLEKYQVEGGYDKLTLDSPLYQSDYKILAIVKFTPEKTITKWKLGQNRSIEKRFEIIEKLRERNQGSDLRAADEVQRWIDLFQV
jgi:predicted FMN-binding regulatory protein PaiB